MSGGRHEEHLREYRNTSERLFLPKYNRLTFFLLLLVQESLDEVTIKDTLEGDNMYTCSQCGKKVRAEKRCDVTGCLLHLCSISCRHDQGCVQSLAIASVSTI